MNLSACFTGHLPGLYIRLCIATARSRPSISKDFHANTSRFRFKNLMYVPFFKGYVMMMKVGRGSSSKPRLASCNSS